MKVLAIALAIAIQIIQPPQPPQPLVFPQPAGSPETIAVTADFPFLPPLQGARLIQTSRVGGPLELKSATADDEAVLAGMGLAVGAVLGVPLLIALHANFPFTQRFDPAVILPAALALAVTALFAGWVPARRASSIQASDALRAD